jgi:hypothetical protein
LHSRSKASVAKSRDEKRREIGDTDDARVDFTVDQ